LVDSAVKLEVTSVSLTSVVEGRYAWGYTQS